MSDSFYLCAASLCVCLVICALVKLVAPSGSTSKILSLVIALFALCCLISPVVSIVKEIDFPSLESETNNYQKQYDEIYNTQVLQTTGDYITDYSYVLLRQADITPLNIKTVIGVSENKGIYVREMNIYINKTDMDKADKVRSIIETSVGIVPEITES